MSDAVGIDPEGLRVLGTAAGGLSETAETVRQRVLDILVAGDLVSVVGSPLALLAEELDLLATLCAERAAAIEDAGTGWVSPLAQLEGALTDGWGSDGMTTPFALETLRIKREELDTDGNGSVSEDELAAAADSADPSVRAAAAWLQQPAGQYAAVTSEGQWPSPLYVGPAGRLPIDGQLAVVNANGTDDVDGLVTGWVTGAIAAGRRQSYSLPVRVEPLGSSPDPLDVFFPHGPATAVVEPRPVPTPDLDGAWLSSLGDLAPAGTAAMVLVYRREEVDHAYTVDPVPDLPGAVPQLTWAGAGGVWGAAKLGSSVAARLNPITATVSAAVSAYEFVNWLAPDEEPRQDTTAVFDVEYRDAEGTVIDVYTNMAVQRTAVTGPVFGGPAIIVLPHRPPETD